MKNFSDTFNRKHDYLRISLTDRCNLRCTYCTPNSNKVHSGKSLLTFEELHRLINIFINYFGIRKIRFTGGEPLVRKNITDLFSMISRDCMGNNVKLGITTNGMMLSEHLVSLKKAGVTLLNISLDSLNRKTFNEITGYDGFDKVIKAIMSANEMGFSPLKINCVVLRNKNLKELHDFVQFTENKNINVRFIEYMPFDNNGWNKREYVSTDEMIDVISEKYKPEYVNSYSNSTSRNFKINGFTGTFGFISPLSNEFCSSCNRIRITADGRFKTCLFTTKDEDHDLKSILASGIFSDEEIATTISEYLKYKKFSHPGTEQLININRDNMISIGG